MGISEQDDQERGANFAAFLASVRGETVDDLTDGMQRLVEKVRETGKPGSLTLTLKVDLYEDDPGVVTVEDQIRMRLPDRARRPSITYPDRNGHLSRTDPNTMPIFDEDVAYDPQTGEVR